MHGAEPFLLQGGRTGCLLLHGFTGTPFEMRMLGYDLNQAGYTVLAPRLFAHATELADMDRARWQDWQASVEDGLNLLKGITDRQVVMGLSMGGVLALLTAARFPVSAVVSFSTPAEMPGQPLSGLLPVLRFVYRRAPKGRPDWHNPDAAKDHIEYPAYPTPAAYQFEKLMLEMLKELGKVSMPALFVQSHEDGTITPGSMDYLYDHVASRVKERMWVQDSGHVVIREPEREKIFQEVRSFVHNNLDNS